jgi:hypothetical protein
MRRDSVSSMRASRLFVSQTVLDRWLSEGVAELAGDTLQVLPERHSFDLQTGVLFENEVTGAGDALGLLGKVKDLEQIAEMAGDYSQGTVIVGDLAYEVTDGFVGIPTAGELLAVISSNPPMRKSGPLPDVSLPLAANVPTISSSDSIEAALGIIEAADVRPKDEVDLLARFFLERR